RSHRAPRHTVAWWGDRIRYPSRCRPMRRRSSDDLRRDLALGDVRPVGHTLEADPLQVAIDALTGAGHILPQSHDGEHAATRGLVTGRRGAGSGMEGVDLRLEREETADETAGLNHRARISTRGEHHPHAGQGAPVEPRPTQVR